MFGDLSRKVQQLLASIRAKQEIVNLRCIGNGAVPTMNFPSATPSANDGSNAIVEDHEVVFQGKKIPTKIYDRAKMTPGAKFDG